MSSPKTIIVTVSDDRFGRKGGKYSDTQDKIEKIFKNNPQFGISNFRMWKREDIVNTDFYKNNNIPDSIITEDIIHPYSKQKLYSAGTIIPGYKLLDLTDPAKNGRVYKPLVIVETLKEMNDGDFLIYTDCSPEMWNMDENYYINPKEFDLKILQNLCIQNDGILTAHVKWNHRVHVNKGEIGFHTHENFTTERCLNRMNMQEYRYSLQHATGLVVLQKCKKSVEFAEEWLYWNSIEDCGCMGPATEPLLWYNEVIQNFKVGHRHDQSVSGLLINKMNHKIIETLDYYERPSGVSPYLLFNFCKPDFKYNFFNSVQPKRNLQHKMVSPDGDPKAGGKWEIITIERVGETWK